MTAFRWTSQVSRNAQTLRATKLNDLNLEVRAVGDGSLNLVGWTWTKMAGAVFLISIHVHMFWDGLIKVIKMTQPTQMENRTYHATNAAAACVLMFTYI